MQRFNGKYTNPTPLDQMTHIHQVAELVKNIANGTVVASAPFPGMGVASYADEQIESHKAFFSSLAAIVAQ